MQSAQHRGSAAYHTRASPVRPAALQWQHIGQMVAADNVVWMGFMMTLVLVYTPLLTAPHRSHLVETSLLPTEVASVVELGAVLELLSPKCHPVLIIGDLNVHSAVLAPTMQGQVPCVSMDPVLNAHCFALLSLLVQQGLLLLSGITQLFHQATYLIGPNPKSAQLLVNYAIASYTAASWFTGVTVGNALLMVSDHCTLMLSLAFPPPLASAVSDLLTLCAYWKPGAQAHWWAHLSSQLFLACL